MTKHDRTMALTAYANQIMVAPENPRSADNIDPHQIDELRDSLMSHGMIYPLVGYWDGESFMVTGGGRRTRAIQSMLEDDTIAVSFEVPINPLDKEAAIEAGYTDELTHSKLTPLDELRIFAQDRYQNASNAELARVVGRSARYVKQRRAILDLPEGVLDNLWAGQITVDQAAGMTYFDGDEESIAEVLEIAIERPGYSGDHIRADFARQCQTWEKHPLAQFVAQEEYVEAGGRLQEDLFAEASFITTPAVLEKLAHEKIDAQVRADFPNVAFVVKAEQPGFPPRHHGYDDLTDEEREEWDDMRFERFQHDRENPDHAEFWARYDRLAERAEPYWPEELEKLLGVVWWTRSFGDEPVCVVEHVLPEDCEPLYEAGWLERPAQTAAPEGDDPGDESEDAPAAPESDLTATVRDRIARIKAHCRRQDMIRDPNRVFQAYLIHVSTGHGWTRSFTATPDAGNLAGQDEALLINSQQWDAAAAMESQSQSEIEAMKPADQRKVLAKKMLDCLTVHHVEPEVDAAMLRKYAALDESFFRAYRKDQLIAMIRQAGSEEEEASLAKRKKSDLETVISDSYQSVGGWLPTGF